MRFTDRNILGKSQNVWIVGMKVWTEKKNLQICGIQCIYKVGDDIKNGNKHVDRDMIEDYNENVYELEENDYVKSISGNISQSNIIEYLIVMSKEEKIGRFGIVKPTQKQFTFEVDEGERPICVYGSL